MTALLLLPVLVFVALAAFAVFLAWRVHAADSRHDKREAVLAVARQEALNLTTISYQTASRDLERIIALATGDFRTKFEQQRKQFPGILAQSKSSERGTVLASALAALHGTNAQVLVAVDAAVTNNQTVAAQQPPQVQHFRMVFTLMRVHGHWLVSNGAFAGAPQ